MNTVLKVVTSAVLILTGTLSYAQSNDTIPLINSSELIAEGVSLHDEEKYEEALALYRQVHEGDSNKMLAYLEEIVTLNAMEKYEETISLAEAILPRSSRYKPEIMESLANAYDLKGDGDKALAIYDSAITLYPKKHRIHYNKGIALYNKERYEESMRSFKEALRIYPFHASSHYQLALLSILQGNRVKAMLSLEIYLAINPGDNKALVLLEDLMNDAVRWEASIEPFDGNDPFQELELIIRSKVALKKNFKPSVKFKASMVNQTELLISEIKKVKQSDDFWSQLYLPFYQSLQEKSHIQAFIYLLLTSTKDEAVLKWKYKNEKASNELSQIALNTIFSFRLVHEHTILGVRDQYNHWFTESHELSAIGNVNGNDQSVGPWEYYHSNGQVQSRGIYGAPDTPTGEWIYYYENGNIQKRVNYDQKGQAVDSVVWFYDNGQLSSITPVKDNTAHGTVQLFGRCGELVEEYSYDNGVTSGPGFVYYNDGKTKVTYYYKEDQLDSTYTIYYRNGQLKESYQYHEGALNGDYVSYFEDGTLWQSGKYKDDEPTGEWITNYENGKLYSKGVYKNGKRNGQWTYYTINGNLRDDEFFNEDGKLHGTAKYYTVDGQLYYTLSYENGKIVQVEYFGENGDSLGTFGGENGNFRCEGYFVDGSMRNNLTYKEGLPHGIASYFYPGGQLKRTVTYDNGVQHGVWTEYHENGKVKIQTGYENDINEGYYRSYYSNGMVQNEGWVKNNEETGLWKAYYPNGALETETFYVNGEINGPTREYQLNGKMLSKSHYKNGRLLSTEIYDSLGGLIQTAVPDNAGQLKTIRPSGSLLKSKSLSCGIKSGEEIWYHKNGEIARVYIAEDGEYSGPFRSYLDNGAPYAIGEFRNSQQHGKWTWYYENGNKSYEATYHYGEKNGKTFRYHENGNIDSECEVAGDKKHGTCKYFDPEGNLQLIKHYDQELGFTGYQYPTSSGELIEIIPFNRSGKFELKAYFENGKLAARQEFENGLLNGASEFYWNNGQLQSKNNYEANELSGESYVYYKNGTVKESETYYHHLNHGVSRKFYPNGSLEKSTTWVYDMKHGLEIKYDENGNEIYRKVYWYNTEY